MPKIELKENKYYFNAEDGTELIECPIWLEKSKANEAHPEGKPHILLPKGNITNRRYLAEDKFIADNVDGVYELDIKTSGPRVLGTQGGVKQDIIKYLDEETATEYTNLVTGAVEAYKEAKANTKKKKPEDMTVEELMAYIEALKAGTKVTIAEGPKSFMEMFTDEEYARYNEIIALAMENKANAPKAKRGPLTEEEKAIRNAKRKANEISKAEKLLAALQASLTQDDDEVDVDELLADDEL